MTNKMHAAVRVEARGARRQWLTKAEIADHIGVSKRSVTKLMRRRVLPYVKVGRIVRFDLEACDRAMMGFQVRSIEMHGHHSASGHDE
jgi:excisionase family DNA binding protein